jgi:glucose-1-phosphate thymidylyltransferase
MAESLKIVVPMAGWGTRMRPHTWSKPKPLVAVAGKTALDHLIDVFASVPGRSGVEFVFILSPNLGELQIPPFMAQHYPDTKVNYVVQAEMKGQSHALYLARKYLAGPMISCFSDTLIETDFSFISRERGDGVVCVKAVPDPRRFGVAEVGSEGLVTRLVEKPESAANNLALVGCYFFRRSEDLMSAIEEQMQRDIALKNEYFLADAVNIMLARRAVFRPQEVDVWMDTGTIEATLETNRHLLAGLWASGRQPSPVAGVRIEPPVYIHQTAVIEASVIGPHVSVGPGCRILGSRIEDSILDADCEITDAALKGSFIGRQATVRGRGMQEVLALNIGDNSTVRLGAFSTHAQQESRGAHAV